MKEEIEIRFEEKLEMYPHLKKIRERLWTSENKSRVSIMVGAGFSLNGQKIESSFEEIALWGDLKSRLIKDLNHHSNLEEKDVLEVGQLYVKEYGRSSLDELLKEAIPDDNYEPGNLHYKLLKLPWTDVYTTNYDTLLERAKKTVYERSYQVIYDINDIPSSVQPRIVKLHGSFPAHRPFIFTTNDYQQYKEKFSPFVNMVQQSIMETTFVLIGFSGDDPNFQSWTSWVSSNLKEHMPKIYMIGYGQEGKRKELEAKGITLIDFKEFYKEIANPYLAMYNDIFKYLRYESRKEKVKWPHRKNAYQAINIKNLQLNRSEYPGWILMPDSIRRKYAEEIYADTERCLRSLATKDMGAEETVVLINEILWCYEKFSLPFEDFHYKKIQEVIEMQDQQSNKLNSLKIKLLKEARLRGDEEEFLKYKYECETSNLNEEEAHSVIFEIVLYHFNINDVQEVENMMQKWFVESNEIEWGIKKAIVFSRIDKKDKAKEMFEEYLQTIRSLLVIKIDDYRLLSLESVILHNLKRISRKWDYGDDRLRVLNIKYCDVNEEFNQTVLSIKKYIYKGGTKEVPGFDPGTGKIQTTFDTFVKPDILDSYAVSKSQESLGLTINNSEQYDLALTNLEVLYPFYSLMRRIHFASYKQIEQIFSRAFVFNINDQHIEFLAKILKQNINRNSLSVINEKVSLEIISRVYIELSPKSQQSIDTEILNYLNLRENYQHEISKVLSNLIVRIIYAKSNDELKNFYETLITTNLLSQKSEDLPWYYHGFFEPFLVIIGQRNSIVSINVSEEKLNFLLEKLNDSTDYSIRESALIRLVYLYISESLKIEQKNKFKDILERLPRNRRLGISDFVYDSIFQNMFSNNENSNNITIEEFIQKEIPPIGNTNSIGSDSSLTSYLNELSRVFPGYVQLEMNSPIDFQLYKQWLDKFYIWWDDQKETLLKNPDEMNVFILRPPDYLKQLIIVLKNKVWGAIPISLIDDIDRIRAREIFDDIIEHRKDLSYFLLPFMERLGIPTTINLKKLFEVLAGQDSKNIKAAFTALYDYLMLENKNEVKTNLNFIKQELIAILKYSFGALLTEVLDLLNHTIRNRPQIFNVNEYKSLLMCITKYMESIQKKNKELVTALDFEILSKYAELLKVISSSETGLNKEDFTELKQYMTMYRLPEVRAMIETI